MDGDDAVSRRLRVSHVIIQPVLVYDDGTDLAPGPNTNPVQVALSDLAGHAEIIRDELRRLNEETPDE